MQPPATNESIHASALDNAHLMMDRHVSEWPQAWRDALSISHVQSLLYDLGLMPEQLEVGSDEWMNMLTVIYHFRVAMGARYGLAVKSDEQREAIIGAVWRAWERPDHTRMGMNIYFARAIADEVIAALSAPTAQPENSAPQGKQEAVAWQHQHGNHTEVSERQLDADEVVRGWAQKPLYLHQAPTGLEQPQQPVILASDGRIRFKPNAIVQHLLDCGGLDMNHLACQDFSDEDRQQFAQLIGYSVSGYSELSYVSDEAYERAEHFAAAIRALQGDKPC